MAMKKPIRVAVTGAAGNIGYALLVRIASGAMLGADQPVKVGAFASSLITFTLFEAAYYCEIMRAGIQSVPKGQIAHRNKMDRSLMLGADQLGMTAQDVADIVEWMRNY